ncbi:hypothetical protein AGLY_001203 [Aphis glycines]|uniref:HAT C-terminal dimerisation domain-containing protein n=1 Tax=Aphis glycines TaxID=307491 RepID=A0A6G0UA63_APHGL|nr:hypothetical protein AGLY_001203 [Aphis glycines]
MVPIIYLMFFITIIIANFMIKSWSKCFTPEALGAISLKTTSIGRPFNNSFIFCQVLGDNFLIMSLLLLGTFVEDQYQSVSLLEFHYLMSFLTVSYFYWHILGDKDMCAQFLKERELHITKITGNRAETQTIKMFWKRIKHGTDAIFKYILSLVIKQNIDDAATCDQLPGAAPISITHWPGFNIENLSSICNRSVFCRNSHSFELWFLVNVLRNDPLLQNVIFSIIKLLNSRITFGLKIIFKQLEYALSAKTIFKSYYLYSASRRHPPARLCIPIIISIFVLISSVKDVDENIPAVLPSIIFSSIAVSEVTIHIFGSVSQNNYQNQQCLNHFEVLKNNVYVAVSDLLLKQNATGIPLPYSSTTSNLPANCALSAVNCLPSSYNHNIDTIKDICKKATFPNIFQLLQVALTMPVSSATRERSFSSMRRLKNWLRAKILEKYSTKKRKLLLVYIPFKLCYYYYHLNNYILHLIVDWNDYNNYKIVFGGIWDLCPLHNFSTPSVWPLVAPIPLNPRASKYFSAESERLASANFMIKSWSKCFTPEALGAISLKTTSIGRPFNNSFIFCQVLGDIKHGTDAIFKYILSLVIKQNIDDAATCDQLPGAAPISITHWPGFNIENLSSICNTPARLCIPIIISIFVLISSVKDVDENIPAVLPILKNNVYVAVSDLLLKQNATGIPLPYSSTTSNVYSWKL